MCVTLEDMPVKLCFGVMHLRKTLIWDMATQDVLKQCAFKNLESHWGDKMDRWLRKFELERQFEKASKKRPYEMALNHKLEFE